jgi:hypothetical protein
MSTDAAGRCIPLLRPHRWTHWNKTEPVKGPFSISGPVFQTRNCLRCGRTQMTGVMVSK